MNNIKHRIRVAILKRLSLHNIPVSLENLIDSNEIIDEFGHLPLSNDEKLFVKQQIAALAEIIKYYRENGADKVYVTTAPENTCGIHVYHNAGFQETGEFDEDGDVELMLVL